MNHFSRVTTVFSPYRWAEEASSLLEHYNPSKKTQDTVDVVFASDEGFLAYTAVALASLLQTYTDARRLRIFLLTDKSLESEHRDRYAALAEIHPFEFREIVIDGSAFRELRTTAGITVATYFRLHMHLFLPEDCTRVVYLDSDVLVRRCIAKLFDYDLGADVLGGVEDSISQYYVQKLSQHPATRHVNAGVLVCDIEAMRIMRFELLVHDFIDAKRYVLLLGDQQIITAILGLKTRFLPVEWNVHGGMFESDWVGKTAGKKNQMVAKDCRKAIADPALVHYTYRRKPWLGLDHPRARDWHKALRLTAYSDVVPSPC